MLNKLILILILFGSLSCTNKIVLRKHKLTKKTENIINYFNTNRTNFDTYSIKYSGKVLNSSGNMKFNGILRIKNNSKIWVNISVGFGIEIGRALLTPDSIKFFNRHSKNYFSDDYNYFKRKYNISIDYDLIQSLFTSNFVLNKDKSNFMVNTDDSSNIELSYNQDPNLKSYYILNTVINELTKVVFKNIKNQSELNIAFSDFIDVQNKTLPKQIDLNIFQKNSKFTLTLKYKKIVINSKIKMPFKIPSKYKKICP